MSDYFRSCYDWSVMLHEGMTPTQRIWLYSLSSIGLLAFFWIVSCFKKPKMPLRSFPVIDKARGKSAGKGEGPKETAPRRSVLVNKMSGGELLEWVDGKKDIQNLADILRVSARKYPECNALGQRPLVQMHKEVKEVPTRVEGEVKMVKKNWFYEERGPFDWMSFKEVYDTVHQLSNGLQRTGVKPKHKLGIYCNSRREWMLIAQACFHSNITLATVYANLGEEGLAYALEQGELEALFTSADLLGMVSKLKKQLPKLKYVFYVDKAEDKVLEDLASSDIKLISWDDLLAAGEEQDYEPSPGERDEIAVIMYTSGTTGPPKGVMLTHRNLCAAVAGAIPQLKIEPTDVFIAALPLAHVLELLAEISLLAHGASIGYGSPKTLTDNLVRNCKGDLTELRPTLMAGVPLIWERIRKNALSKINDSGFVVKTIFNFAYAMKKFYGKSAIFDPIFNALVFNKFKGQIGGRVRLMMSGGAAISAETHEFMRVCFAPLMQGYGLTETCGASCLMPPEHPGFSIVGPPLASTEIKLRDVPEMHYHATNLPRPQGEVCIRGPTVSVGYFKMEEKTKEDFSEDGWFFTGDIGEWTEDGCLAIIDRKKNLVKLAHGEYIALEKMETKYKDSQFVEHVACYGNSDVEYPIAIVQPSKAALQKWAATAGLGDASYEDICNAPEARKKVLTSIQEQARAASFKEIEIVKDVILVSDEWTPENDLLTAAMKLQRNKIYKKYEKEIKNAYKSSH